MFYMSDLSQDDPTAFMKTAGGGFSPITPIKTADTFGAGGNLFSQDPTTGKFSPTSQFMLQQPKSQDKIAQLIAAAGQAAPSIAQTVLSFRKPVQVTCADGRMVFVNQGSTQEQVKAACGEQQGGAGGTNWNSVLLVGGVVIGVGVLAYLIAKRKK